MGSQRKQTKAPAAIPRWRLATGQRHQIGFVFAIQLAQILSPGPMGAQRFFQFLFHKPLAYPLNGCNTDIQGCMNLLIDPALIRSQENASMRHFSHSLGSAGEQGIEQLLFFFTQVHQVFLAISVSLLVQVISTLQKRSKFILENLYS